MSLCLPFTDEVLILGVGGCQDPLMINELGRRGGSDARERSVRSV